MFFGNICYVKDNIAVVYKFRWFPCNMDTGSPLSTQMFVDTYEELETVINEGGLKIWIAKVSKVFSFDNIQVNTNNII